MRTAIDGGGPLHIERRDHRRTLPLDHERAAAESFLRVLAPESPRPIYLRPKTVEDGDINDRYVVDGADRPVALLQIRRLDDEQASALGKSREFIGTRSSVEIAASIEHAIDDKRYVDDEVKANQNLLLVAEHPIGEIIRMELSIQAFDTAGYAAVWIVPHDETPFRLRSR